MSAPNANEGNAIEPVLEGEEPDIEDVPDDKVLLVGGVRIPCNRERLCRMCDYFSALLDGDFAESQQEEVELVDQDPAIIKQLVNLSRNGALSISPDNLPLLAAAGHMMQVILFISTHL